MFWYYDGIELKGNKMSGNLDDIKTIEDAKERIIRMLQTEDVTNFVFIAINSEEEIFGKFLGNGKLEAIGMMEYYKNMLLNPSEEELSWDD